MHKELKQNKGVAFIQKLFKIVRSKENAKSIAWDHKNQAIKIINENLLVAKVLHRYFKLKTFSSFVRQLNIYNFHKVKISENQYVFKHQIFNPFDQQSLSLIKRKVSFKTPQKQKDFLNEENIQPQNSKTVQQQSMKIVETNNQVRLKKSIIQQIQQSSRRMFSQKSSKSSLGSHLSNEELLNFEIALKKLIQKLQKVPSQQRMSKLKKWRINSGYRRFLMNKQFYQKVIQVMKLQKQQQTRQIKSSASIEGLCTKKSLDNFKFLESGPLNVRGTIVQPTFNECMINSLPQNGTLKNFIQ